MRRAFSCATASRPAAVRPLSRRARAERARGRAVHRVRQVHERRAHDAVVGKRQHARRARPRRAFSPWMASRQACAPRRARGAIRRPRCAPRRAALRSARSGARSASQVLAGTPASARAAPRNGFVVIDHIAPSRPPSSMPRHVEVPEEAAAERPAAVAHQRVVAPQARRDEGVEVQVDQLAAHERAAPRRGASQSTAACSAAIERRKTTCVCAPFGCDLRPIAIAPCFPVSRLPQSKQARRSTHARSQQTRVAVDGGETSGMLGTCPANRAGQPRARACLWLGAAICMILSTPAQTRALDARLTGVRPPTVACRATTSMCARRRNPTEPRVDAGAARQASGGTLDWVVSGLSSEHDVLRRRVGVHGDPRREPAVERAGDRLARPVRAGRLHRPDPVHRAHAAGRQRLRTSGRGRLWLDLPRRHVRRARRAWILSIG